MSLSKLCAGRKRESNVWELFVYTESTDKSMCHAVMSDGKTCGFNLAGKNTTNLKVT